MQPVSAFSGQKTNHDVLPTRNLLIDKLIMISSLVKFVWMNYFVYEIYMFICISILNFSFHI